MAYVKNTWVDQEVERPKTYEMTNNPDGSVTLIDSFGIVTKLGTPVNADNMNHIEDGIAEHEDRITLLEEGADTSDYVQKSGDTMTGDLYIAKDYNPILFIKNTSQERGVAPSSNAGVQYLYFLDKNNDVMGSVAIERYTDGRNTIKLQAFSADGTLAPAVRVNAYADNTIGCDFPRCTTKATTTPSARSDLVAVVVQNYVNGTSWYRVWSDGWIEQGGYVSTDGFVTLLKAFSTTNYSVTFGGFNTGTNNNGVPRCVQKQTSQFKYSSAGVANCPANWRASGY